MTVDDLRCELAERRGRLSRLRAENDFVRRQVDGVESELRECARLLGLGQAGLQFLEDLANARRASTKGGIERVVTDALRLVYGPRYSVELEYDVKNNRSWLDVIVVKRVGGLEVRRGPFGFGGGLVDTVSVPLRLLAVVGSDTDRVCVLDESYKHLPRARVELAAGFISGVCRELGLQVVMLSHHEAMRRQSDRVFRLEDDGERAVLVDADEETDEGAE